MKRFTVKERRALKIALAALSSMCEGERVNGVYADHFRA